MPERPRAAWRQRVRFAVMDQGVHHRVIRQVFTTVDGSNRGLIDKKYSGGHRARPK